MEQDFWNRWDNGTDTMARPATPDGRRDRYASTARRASHDRRDNRQDTNGGPGLGVLAGAAGAGMVFGILAMIGRKAAVQAPTYLAGEWHEALAAEHKAVLALFDTLETTTPDQTAKRTTLFMQIKHALAKHAMQEENVIYPAMREAGDKDAADHLNHDHGYVKQHLFEMANADKGSAEFMNAARTLRAEVEKHAREEEQELFPRLHAKLSDEKNKMLTKAMNKEGFILA